jgi:biotin carboxyl carrier protein
MGPLDPPAQLARVARIVTPTAVRVGEGVYRIVREGRAEIVYVAGTESDWWAFWNGEVFRAPVATDDARPRRLARSDAKLSLTAPMPATVIKVLVEPGATVERGSTLVVLEAMKMEMAIRATENAIVEAVYCRPGDLVQADAVLVDLK